MNAPQIIMVALLLLSIASESFKGDTSRKKVRGLVKATISCLLFSGLLLWGGFWR